MSDYLRVPDVPFTDASLWTPELGYFAFQAPVFDDEVGLLGHRQRILDSELSNQPGQLKDRFTRIADGLRPIRPATGRLVTIRSGVVTTADGLNVTIPQTVLQMPDTGTVTIFVDQNGVLSFAAVAPVICEVIATVTTANGEITNFIDYRDVAIRPVLPLVSAIKVFGGTNSIDVVASQNDNYRDGVIYCRDFIIPAGVTVSVDRYLKIVCSGTFRVQGTMVITAGLSPGVNPFGVIRANDMNLVTPNVAPGLGSTGRSYPWAAGGFSGSGGSAGQSQARQTTTTVWTVGRGGDSGGTLIVEAVNVEVTGNGSIQANGSDGAEGNCTLAVNPGFRNSTDYCQIGGGGGGSGGLVHLSAYRSITVAPTANIQVRGGTGGRGFVNASNGLGVSHGGRPGSGGYIVLMAPSINVSGANLDRSPGNHGEAVGATYTSANVIRYTPTQAHIGGALAGGNGGAYGGSSGGFSRTFDGTNFFDTFQPSEPGQLILRFFVPTGG